MPIPKKPGSEESQSGEVDVEFTSPLDPREDSLPVTEDRMSWREELSGRVRDFRRRRARLRNEPENLGFDFEPADAAPEEPGEEEALEFPSEVRAADPAVAPEVESEQGPSPLEEAPVDREAEEFAILDSAAVQPEEKAKSRPLPAGDSLEIVVGPVETDAQEVALEPAVQALPLAPIGRRFLAGLVDGLVLLVGAGLFAVIFWKAGGRLTPVPLNLLIAGVIAAIFILAYFGLFTTLTFSTPGLIWMGIEVRNMEGWPPTIQEAFLRAFGYLVSVLALMIGFLWALVDSEGLTWHDRISGTFLTPISYQARVE